MNEIIGRLLDLPTRQRVLLLVGALALLFLAWGYLLYLPRADRVAELEARVEQMTRDRDRMAGLASNLERARKVAADLDAALKQAVAQLPDTKEIPELLSGISTVGREAGLDIIQFRQRPEQPVDFYAEVPAEILVRGRFGQVASFFDQVSRLTRIVNVSDIRIKTPPRVDREGVVLETSCTVTTFRFLDEEERERIAKEREKKER